MAPICAPVRAVGCDMTETGTDEVGDTAEVVVEVGVRVGPRPSVTTAVMVVCERVIVWVTTGPSRDGGVSAATGTVGMKSAMIISRGIAMLASR